jgi:hypothetical protein
MQNESRPVLLALKPYVPAKQFELSKRFYLDVGFIIVKDTQKAAELQMGECCFVLQNFFDTTRGQYSFLELIVTDIDAWWRQLEQQDLARRYNVRLPHRVAANGEPPSILLHDPSGVVWHIREPGARTETGVTDELGR